MKLFRVVSAVVPAECEVGEPAAAGSYLVFRGPDGTSVVTAASAAGAWPQQRAEEVARRHAGAYMIPALCVWCGREPVEGYPCPSRDCPPNSEGLPCVVPGAHH
ncbi:MAG: hypothetical protein A3D44_01160 [Candidatus Staskawiczbacteria bacterium RIFCSPHIGHO2_02_FULL_42_22]|uniref:Uncharacterized protein n=1 Tax=Candidatus Staskawiczbacteria bacterium RIFCSPHIGHO2_02_FULL_42_22 TaxID=1802207 RepID=A0A1G2I379_9BACT|nr:MAG: hypothetical protein A3D44_01160 [Candidatus Staskawiczbacteria bacterium RIFCSPHIGHO2_02_FULL_42_22]